ncbi:hypothetical protein MKA27_17780 [[Clostridium] innocuum]|uniref:hypothetical protein n=1 Tax=Clostridium innocuum TaxID=1522 RepID=UPI000D6DAEE4|nr:hypothetical protein [[Clostridium] innocuum]MCR0316368.1 hypothetical protein [[Clostridium] innocuum]MCR0370905.1 hypothetical protein [[Clostridium] innocuum]MCR0375641.1 hypothetical protein [[Clostridium] innocuum]MCR0560881.1 hypothetical protein [[Clostridium] innocuum]MCR0603655.1 hypothetical protein [[Clostridium] innocuum]
MQKEKEKGKIIFDYKKGNTRIVIYDDAIVPEEEQELIYERVRNIIISSQIRRKRDIEKENYD